MCRFFYGFLVFILFANFISCDEKKDNKTSSSNCGDLLITQQEKCDGVNLDNQTCETLGFGAGSLECAENCLEFDTTGCGASLSCGDGIKNVSDICDGDDLGGESCISKGFEPGTLKCMSNCAGFDTSECGKSVNCGNGKIDSGEVCDGSELNGRTCIDEGFEQGELKCSEDCKAYDKTDCSTPCTKECGERVCGPDPVCGESCGECTGDFEMCSDAGKCEKTCDLDPIDAERKVDVNLETVTISGEISLNGVTPANNSKQGYENESRGSVGFINKKSGSTVYIGIGSAGKAAFSATIFKGTYDIVFSPNNLSYQNVFPDLNMIFEKDVVLESNATRNFNLETVDISGKITIDGSAMPDNTKQGYEYESRGSVRFTNKDSASTLNFPISSTGEASFNEKLYKGNYDISFSPNNGSYQNSVPAMQVTLEKNIEVNSKVTKNFNLETVQISGKVTLNSSVIPNNTKQGYENESRASVVIINTESGGSLNLSVGSSGVAAFSAKIFKGTYNFSFIPNNQSYQNSIPFINMILEKDVDISADMTRNFNLDTVNISGKITINGFTMPNNSRQGYESESRGSIGLKNNASGGSIYFSIGSSGEAAFNLTVFKGTYNFSLSPNNSSYQNAIPSINLNLEKDVAITENTVKNFNLETFTISGKISLNGSTMPNNSRQGYESESRGSIGLKNKESGASLFVGIGSSGVAAYSTTVFKGTYDVMLYPGDSSYQNVIPAVENVLENNVSIQAGTTKDFNVETVEITGSVKLNNAVMPNNTKQGYESESRGGLLFRNKSSSDALYITIGSNGNASFSLTVFKGSYDVDFSSNGASYQNVLPDQTVKIYKGCFDYSAGCDMDSEDISGTWEFVPDGAYWKPVTFYLTQNGEEITGTFDSWNSSGSIEPGTRKGTYFKFQFDPYYEMIVDGTIVSGCVILGRFDTIGYSGGNYDSDFVGYKVP